MRDEMIQEMISAYLDDELSSSDRALVEGWMEAEPRHRQYHDNLARLGDQLRGLPSEKVDDQLGRSLRDDILAQIELVASTEEEPAADVIVDTQGPSRLDSPASVTQASLVLRITMTVISVAAALALVIYIGNPFSGDPIDRIANIPVDPGPVDPGPVDPETVDQGPTHYVMGPQPASFIVLDLSLSEKGIRQDSAAVALDKAGIGLANAIPVDTTLESALLESRYFGTAAPGAPKQDDDAAPEVLSMTYIVVNGPKFDAIFAHLKDEQTNGAVTKMLFDVAFMNDDASLFKMLHSAAEYQIASVEPATPATSSSDEGTLRIRAQRLLLTAALQTKLGRGLRMAVPAAGLMSGLLKGDSQSDAAAEGNGDQRAPEPGGNEPRKPTPEQLHDMASKTVGVLVVVRRAASEAP